MEFRVLGPLEVISDNGPVEVGGARARAVLEMLLVRTNQVVSADRLVDELWPGQPADRAAASLQVRVAGLRKALRAAGEADRLVTRPPGYLLRAEPAEVDVLRFERLVEQGNAALAAGEPAVAAERLTTALTLWRGRPLTDADAAPSARAEAARLDELRATAFEARAEALLACGRHRELIAGLEAHCAQMPLRERLWSALILALYRSGRQADALRAYREVREILASELGIEPGTELRDLNARILRQDPSLDHPPRAGPPAADPASLPRPLTRYARTDDGIHLAFQVLGSGERDIVFVPGLMSHLDLLWEDEETAAFFRRLSELGRLVLFDKRDTGLSDRGPGDCSLEQRIDDVHAVMRGAGTTRAVLFGYSEGAPMSILLAASYPERVTALILGSASARWMPAPGYPCGQDTAEMLDELEEIAEHRWGQGASIEWYLPSRADMAHSRELFARFERMAVTPSAFLRLTRMIRDIDVRDALPSIHMPTLVVQRLGDRITPPCHGRYLAAHIPGARYIEQPGDHSLRFAGGGDLDALCAEISGFLAGVPASRPPDHWLATILVAELGGEPGGGEDVRRLVAAHRGRIVGPARTSVTATFAVPGQAIRCADALRAGRGAAGRRIRAGIHAGEVAGDDIAGISARIACGVAAVARPGEILVSRTVRDLVAGSDFAFAARGSHELARAPGEWSLFAVAGTPAAGTAGRRDAAAAEQPGPAAPRPG